MTTNAQLYGSLFEHIQAFEDQFCTDENDDLDQFIGDIKKRIVFQYIDACKITKPLL